MCAPATAALLIAALAALPCRGTDADAASRIHNKTSSEETSQPTINRFYQMLHTSSDLHNQSNLLEISNSSLNLTNSYNFHGDLYSSLSKIHKCCQTADATEGISLSKEGAKYVNTQKVDKDRKRARKRRVVNVVRVDGNATRDYRRLEATTVFPMRNRPFVNERKRKPGDPIPSAPLLNYIFDSYSNTHQHRGDRNGNNIYAGDSPEVEALVGSTAHLDCKVDALHDKLVSWVRRKNDVDPMELLTTGTQLYTADDRYSARFIQPDTWRLEVKGVKPSDASNYDCQLSAHPPRTARVTLTVPEVSVRIVDGAGAEVSEQVCEVGSTVALRCEVKGLRMEGGPSLLWYRREVLLNDDTTRGGISVRTDLGAKGANSVLHVARVRADDAGRYTCNVTGAPAPAPPPAHVLLHIIKGESLAELHQGGKATTLGAVSGIAITMALCVNLLRVI